MENSEYKEGQKWFFAPLKEPCIIASIMTQAGGVSGEKNIMVTVVFTGTKYGRDVRTFPLGMADDLLKPAVKRNLFGKLRGAIFGNET